MDLRLRGPMYGSVLLPFSGTPEHISISFEIGLGTRYENL